MWQLDGRNKRSIALDLKTEEGMAVMHQLVSECDVFITNQPFPLRDKLGLNYEDLKIINPKMNMEGGAVGVSQSDQPAGIRSINLPLGLFHLRS